MANTLTGNNPQREQRIQALLLGRIAIKYDRRIAREIARAMTEYGNAVGRGDTISQPAILAKHRRNMDRILTNLWEESGADMSNHIAGQEKAIAGFEKKQTSVPPTEVASRVMTGWISTYGSARVVEITNTTREDIKAIVKDGIEEGLGEKEIAKNIRANSAIRGAARSGTIARTETHSAANVAADATAKASGVQMKREWVAANNERTRKAHREADGQVVGMNEKFIVDGHELNYPSDSTSGAPAYLTINCRCAVAYILQ